MSGGEPAHRQRIRIGLTGLGFVFLLVMIGAAITRWGATESDLVNEAIIANVDAPPTDPLAEIGAAPGESSASTNAIANASDEIANATNKP
jgi:hypothetical protein